MEFLRFGSSIPGSYWGCCAMDIIQNFNFDPDAKASIQIVDGDGGYPVTNSKGFMFAGPTYKDIFLQRLRYGTFGTDDMPNHGFIAILTHYQVNNSTGKKWLALLKENGFEFIRTVDNSVYTGEQTISAPGQGFGEPEVDESDWDCDDSPSHPNYVFALFRNIGSAAIKDPYAPPKAWTDLPNVVPEYVPDDGPAVAKAQQECQLPLYNALPKGKFLSEKELEDAKVPVTYAGLRSENPQESKVSRLAKTQPATKAPAKAAPFMAAPAPALAEVPVCAYDDSYTDESVI